ncbi:putative TetR family transcriptional regulator [Gordonia effusa NBRC 100432]|uniref:Putative TetR family transcriptional regulator n=1 Tax=Gordonia effusa NBRC 100432 TaxID=1077974 RepID=H0QXJ1_9ACTN|nr:TetR/AcrR family transcriptional regulator [Gordonia effusa]GAB17542.1 putative TetR family transcriptional regulator [Gordonia effusa NBRC 100432]
MTQTTASTRDRLLDCAESLLAAAPYETVSVRSICASADANVAAVHYHFGTKEDLVVALLNERLAPHWERPLDDLDERPRVADIVDAILTPFLRLHADPLGRLHLRLLARVVDDADQSSWHGRWFSLDTWSALLPRVDRAQARRRWALAFDLILRTFSRTETPLSDDAVSALREFVIAGLGAPVR